MERHARPVYAQKSRCESAESIRHGPGAMKERPRNCSLPSQGRAPLTRSRYLCQSHSQRVEYCRSHSCQGPTWECGICSVSANFTHQIMARLSKPCVHTMDCWRVCFELRLQLSSYTGGSVQFYASSCRLASLSNGVRACILNR
jgi:hypothetical protein